MMNKEEKIKLLQAFNKFCDIHKIDNNAQVMIEFLNNQELINKEKCLKFLDFYDSMFPNKGE